MKTKFSLSIKALIAGAILIATGCDIVNEDASIKDIKENINPFVDKKFSAFAFAGKPSVINLSALYSGKVFDLATLPESIYGDLTLLTSKDNKKFLVYTPNESFIGKKEDLIVEIPDKGVNLNVTMESLDGLTSCKGPVGIYDYREMHSGDTLIIDLLDNDLFCAVSYNGGLIGEHHIENSENVLLKLGPGRIATLTYVAPKNFTGKVRLIYDLGINWIVDTSNRPPLETILSNPEKYLEAFTTTLVEIEVTN